MVKASYPPSSFDPLLRNISVLSDFSRSNLYTVYITFHWKMRALFKFRAFSYHIESQTGDHRIIGDETRSIISARIITARHKRGEQKYNIYSE